MIGDLQEQSLSFRAQRGAAPITLAAVGGVASTRYRTVAFTSEPWNRPTAFKLKHRRRLCL